MKTLSKVMVGLGTGALAAVTTSATAYILKHKAEEQMEEIKLNSETTDENLEKLEKLTKKITMLKNITNVSDSLVMLTVGLATGVSIGTTLDSSNEEESAEDLISEDNIDEDEIFIENINNNINVNDVDL